VKSSSHSLIRFLPFLQLPVPETRLDSTTLVYSVYPASVRVRVTSRLAVYRKSVLATSPLRLTTNNFIFQLNTCGYSPYVNPLWRDDGSVVYNCCWSSPAKTFSGRSPAGLTTTFYRLVPVFISPRNRWPGYIPRQWFPFSSPPMTGRATVEVFDPTSTRMSCRTFL
jgi:hypothetical protein